MFGNIPEELKAKTQWVVWRKSDGKKPVNPHTLEYAKSNDASTWSTYNKAIEVVEKGKADGVGFQFNNDYIGIDLDDCFDENKKAKEWAATILKRLMPTYMEYSVSKTGIHILVPRTQGLPGKGLNVNFKLKKLYDGIGGVEIYENGRYFITTGHILSNQTNKIQGDSLGAIETYIKYKNIDDRHKDIQKKTVATISDYIFDDIKRYVSMERIATDYGVRIGRDKKACCPFHSEKTASFQIYEHDYYCFGCQDYGDAVSFVKKKEGLLSNFEAAKLISEKYNLRLFDEAPIKKAKPTVSLKLVAEEEPDESIEELLSMALNVSKVKPHDPSNAKIVNSGIPSLDKIIGGFELGLLTVWTGVNAAGKSTVLGQCMAETIDQGYNVFAFSGELMAHKFQYWMDLQLSGSNHLTKKVSKQTGKDYYEISNYAKDKIHSWYDEKMYLYDNKCGLQYTKLLKVMDAYAVHKNCKVFLIDNIMRLDLRELDRDEYIAQSQFINSIADFAQTRKVHVHVVAHPRKVKDSIITKMDISGSGDLTNRADIVLAVHRTTAAFKEEIKKRIKGPALEKILSSTNLIEVFKLRDGGEQDSLISLKYIEGSKRLVDLNHLDLADKQYGWDKAPKQNTLADLPEEWRT